jgi:hypothetical protein
VGDVRERQPDALEHHVAFEPRLWAE